MLQGISIFQPAFSGCNFVLTIGSCEVSGKEISPLSLLRAQTFLLGLTISASSYDLFNFIKLEPSHPVECDCPLPGLFCALTALVGF